MTITEHLNQQDPARLPLLQELHAAILKNDPSALNLL